MTSFAETNWGYFRPTSYTDPILPHQIVLKRKWRESLHTMHTHLSCNCGWDGGFVDEGVQADEDIAFYKKHLENPEFVPDRVFEEQEKLDRWNPLAGTR